jgi:hypothetical protein
MINIKFNILFLSLLIGLSISVFAQSTISGQIFDSVSKEPIQFANVGIMNSGIGSISNKNGEFVFDVNRVITYNDTLRISIIGYKSLDVLLQSVSGEKNSFYLEPMTYELNEIIIKPKETIRFGNNSKSEIMRASFSKANSLGAQLGTMIKIKKKHCRLKEFSFNIINNSFDSLTFRLNIYTISKNIPDNNLLNNDIVFKIYQSKGLFTINLEEYSVFVKEDVIICLELLELFGADDSKFDIPASVGGISYFRLASQDKWNRLKMIKLGYSIKADCE